MIARRTLSLWGQHGRLVRFMAIVRSRTEDVELYSHILPGPSDSRNILVLHGLFGKHTNWLHIFTSRTFQSLCRVHLIDVRNHGLSDQHPSMRYCDLAEDVLRYADRAGIKKFSLLGHSMGGKAAMTLAAAHPDRVNSVVIVDVPPTDLTGGQNFATHIKPALDRMQKMTELSPSLLRTQAIKQMFEEFKDDRSLAATLEQCIDLSSPTLKWQCNMPFLFANISTIFGFVPVAGQFDKPDRTLVIMGEKSHVYGPETYRTIFPRISQENMEVVRGAGHWVHAEKPRETKKLLERFFKRICPDI